MRDLRQLDVWHKAHALTLATYRATENFTKSETFGPVTTMRRGATHLTMKIAEGCGQDLPADYNRCLQQARGVGVEVEYQLLLARDLQLLAIEVHDALHGQVVEVRRMLSGLLRSGKPIAV